MGRFCRKLVDSMRFELRSSEMRDLEDAKRLLEMFLILLLLSCSTSN